MLSTRNLKLKGKTGTFKAKYVGPFLILRMVGKNTCKLEMAEAMTIHPVVNVSQVKKYHGTLQRPLPMEIDGEEEYEVEEHPRPQKIRQRLPVSGPLGGL